MAVIEVGPDDGIEDDLLDGLVNGEHARQPLERDRASFAGRSVQFAEKRPLLAVLEEKQIDQVQVTRHLTMCSFHAAPLSWSCGAIRPLLNSPAGYTEPIAQPVIQSPLMPWPQAGTAGRRQ